MLCGCPCCAVLVEQVNALPHPQAATDPPRHGPTAPASRLAGALRYEAGSGDVTRWLQQSVDKAAQLKPTPYKLQWKELEALPKKPPSEYTGAELLQAKYAVSAFLAANSPSVFSKEVLSRVSPAALFLGAEGSGKSSTVAGILGRALTFTASDSARQDATLANSVGTRCPTKLTIRRATDPTQITGDVVRVTGVQGVPDSTILTPQETARRVAEHMDSLRFPPGVSAEPITVAVEASVAPLPLVCFDLPGMVGEDHREGGLFSQATHALTRDMVDQWVLNPASSSRAFAVTSTKQPLRLGSYLNLLLDPPAEDGRRYLSNRVTWVVTGIELTNQDENKRLAAIDSDDKLKEYLMRSLVDTVKERTVGKQWPATFFLVANADMEEGVPGLTPEQRYQKVKDNIANEIKADNVRADSPVRTSEFLYRIRQQRATYIQHLAPAAQDLANTAWAEWERAHIGLGALQSFVHEVSLKDAARELEFARDFLVACKQAMQSDLEQSQRLLLSVGKQPDTNALLEEIVMAMKDLFYYVVSHKSMPAEQPATHLLPSASDKEELMRTQQYATLLKEDAGALVKFPDNLSAAEDEYLYSKVNPVNAGADQDSGRRPQILERLKRFLTNFHIRVALCAPEKETPSSLQFHTGQAAAGTQASGLEGYLVRQVDRFVSDILGGKARQYVGAGMERIMDSAVDLSLKLLQKQPRYRQYLIQNSTPTKFNKDLERYAHEYFTGAVTRQVHEMCTAAAHSISTPLLPQFPLHFRLAAVLMPRDSAFVRSFVADHNNVSRERTARDVWPSARLVKNLVNATTALGDTNTDAAFEHWDWLDDADSRKQLVDVVSAVMREQAASSTLLGLTQFNDTVTPDDARAFNHCLLLHTRAIIVQYSFQMRVLLPKTYRSLQTDAFLTSTAIKSEFLQFVQRETEQDRLDREVRDRLRKEAADDVTVVDGLLPTKQPAGQLHTSNGGPGIVSPAPTRPSSPLPLDSTDKSSRQAASPQGGGGELNHATGAPVTLASYYKDDVPVDPSIEYSTQVQSHTATFVPLRARARQLLELVSVVGGAEGEQKLLEAINEQTRRE